VDVNGFDSDFLPFAPIMVAVWNGDDGTATKSFEAPARSRSLADISALSAPPAPIAVGQTTK
jgi:hypothetical protein